MLGTRSCHLLVLAVSSLMLSLGKYRDVIFLDLALEGALRRLVESRLGDLNSKEGNLEQLVDVTAMCLENACLSIGSNTDLVLCLKDFQASACSCCQNRVGARVPTSAQTLQAAQLAEGKVALMRAIAAAERTRLALGAVADRIVGALQPTAETLGQALGLPIDVYSIFSEEVSWSIFLQFDTCLRCSILLLRCRSSAALLPLLCRSSLRCWSQR